MKQAFIFTKEKTYNKFMKKFEKAGLLWLSGKNPTYYGNLKEVVEDDKIVVLIEYDTLSYASLDFFLENKRYYYDYDLVYDQRRHNGKKFKRYYYRNGLTEHEQIMTLNNGKYTTSKTNDFDYLISEGYNLVYDGKWGK